MSLEPEKKIAVLESFIAKQGAYADVRLENFARMSGGVSHEMWSFDATLGGTAGRNSRKLVLRLDPTHEQTYTGRWGEFMVMRAAYREGIPVPEVLWLCEDSALLGGPFFIMEFVNGETIARRLLRDECYVQARERVAEQMAEILARIHRIDVRRHGLEFLPAPAHSAAREEVFRYQEIYRQFSADDPHPVLELAIRWLLEHHPRSEMRGVVHGDYRLGNVVYGPEGVRAILDFEGAHVGDPMEDVGWIMLRPWRYGEEHKPVAGLASREAFYAAYERASGIPVDPETVRFWEIFGNFRWAVITMRDGRAYSQWRPPSIELASIGRRTAESELELLNLIG